MFLYCVISNSDTTRFSCTAASAPSSMQNNKDIVITFTRSRIVKVAPALLPINEELVDPEAPAVVVSNINQPLGHSELELQETTPSAPPVREQRSDSELQRGEGGAHRGASANESTLIVHPNPSKGNTSGTNLFRVSHPNG
eukprot:m.191760 g.191760  ORF g.191760 m.191760 type:complete len:141 (+) comp18599_c0_seq1:719-1141(+)